MGREDPKARLLWGGNDGDEEENCRARDRHRRAGRARGAWTTASAQQDPEQRKALFTLLIDKVFNASDLALADGLVARNVTNDGSRMGRDAFKAMLAAGHRQDLDRQPLVDDIVTRFRKPGCQLAGAGQSGRGVLGPGGRARVGPPARPSRRAGHTGAGLGVDPDTSGTIVRCTRQTIVVPWART